MMVFDEIHLAPPPPCFAWSPSPASQGRSQSAASATPILPCEAGEGDHVVVEGAHSVSIGWTVP
jgi:hypothetical protein